MITFTIIAALIIAIVAVLALIVFTGGAVFITIFGDLIMFCAIIWAIVKVIKLFTKNNKTQEE